MNPSCTIRSKNPKYREKMNKKTLASGTQRIQRFSNVGTQPYDPGTVSSMAREQSDMVASMLLICDDCITYHVIRCAEEGVTSSEFYEALNVALVVGGSITIPHIRRAVERLEECGVSGRPAQSKRDQILDHAI